MAFQMTILEFSVLLASLAFVILVISLVRVLKRLDQLIADLQVKSNRIDSIFSSLATTGEHMQGLSMTLKEETEARKDRLGSLLAMFHIGMDLYQTMKEKRRDVV